MVRHCTRQTPVAPAWWGTDNLANTFPKKLKEKCLMKKHIWVTEWTQLLSTKKTVRGIHSCKFSQFLINAPIVRLQGLTGIWHSPWIHACVNPLWKEGRGDNMEWKERRIQIRQITAFLLCIKDEEIKLRQAVGGWQTPDSMHVFQGAMILFRLRESFNYASFDFIHDRMCGQKIAHHITYHGGFSMIGAIQQKLLLTLTLVG